MRPAVQLCQPCQRHRRDLAVQPRQKFINSGRIVAHKHHIATGVECGMRTLDYGAGDARALHAQVVAEDRALETHLTA